MVTKALMSMGYKRIVTNFIYIISFYDNVPMFKTVNNKKVPMTSLEKFLYRARAVNLLTTDETAKIAEWDETKEWVDICS